MKLNDGKIQKVVVTTKRNHRNQKISSVSIFKERGGVFFDVE